MPITEREQNRRQYQYEKLTGRGLLDRLAAKLGIESTVPTTKAELLRKWTEKTRRQPAIGDVEMWKRINAPKAFGGVPINPIEEDRHESRRDIDMDFINDLFREGETDHED